MAYRTQPSCLESFTGCADSETTLGASPSWANSRPAVCDCRGRIPRSVQWQVDRLSTKIRCRGSGAIDETHHQTHRQGTGGHRLAPCPIPSPGHSVESGIARVWPEAAVRPAARSRCGRTARGSRRRGRCLIERASRQQLRGASRGANPTEIRAHHSRITPSTEPGGRSESRRTLRTLPEATAPVVEELPQRFDLTGRDRDLVVDEAGEGVEHVGEYRRVEAWIGPRGQVE